MVKAAEWSIGEVARATGLSVRAIRHYEGAGLVRPRRQHGGGGHRRFDASTVDRLRFIAQARTLGLGISDVRHLAELLDEARCPGGSGVLQALLSQHRTAIDRQIKALHELRARIDTVLDTAGSGSCACGENGCGCLDGVQAVGGRRLRVRNVPATPAGPRCEPRDEAGR